MAGEHKWEWRPGPGVRVVLLALLFVPVSVWGYVIREDEPELVALFEEAGVTGTLVMFDVDRDVLRVVNPARANRRYVPASTFKILNTLIGLETGVVEGPDTRFRWDGEPREIEAWNRDHTLESAFRESVVWVYQAIARAVGLERMRALVRASGYGNGAVGGAVDRFWLSGPLAISAREQVEFLQRMYFGELPFGEQTIERVQSIMLVEREGGSELFGKTGWARRVGPDLGWLVGYHQSERGLTFFAVNLDIREPRDAHLRMPLVKRALATAGG